MFNSARARGRPQGVIPAISAIVAVGLAVILSTAASAAPSASPASTASVAPVAARAPAPVKITGVRVYSAPSPGGFNSNSTRTATASCPSGQRVLAGGAKVITRTGGSTYGNTLLHALVPGTSTYFARAVEKVGGYSGDWALSAYAVCAPVPASLGVEIVSRGSDDSVEHIPPFEYVNDVAAPCPSGKRITGTGGVLGGPPGTVSFQQIRPNQKGAYSFVQGVREAGQNTKFTVTATAICAYPIQGWHVVIDGTDDNDDRLQVADAECPDGEQLIGGGLTKGDGIGWAHVETVRPLGSPFQKLSVIGGLPDHYPYDWNLAAWAVCVDL